MISAPIGALAASGSRAATGVETAVSRTRAARGVASARDKMRWLRSGSLGWEGVTLSLPWTLERYVRAQRSSTQRWFVLGRDRWASWPPAAPPASGWRPRRRGRGG